MNKSKEKILGLLSLGPYHTNLYAGQDLSPHPYFKPGKNKRTKPKKRQMTHPVIFFFAAFRLARRIRLFPSAPQKSGFVKSFLRSSSKKALSSLSLLTFLPSCAYFRLPFGPGLSRLTCIEAAGSQEMQSDLAKFCHGHSRNFGV